MDKFNPVKLQEDIEMKKVNEAEDDSNKLRELCREQAKELSKLKEYKRVSEEKIAAESLEINKKQLKLRYKNDFRRLKFLQDQMDNEIILSVYSNLGFEKKVSYMDLMNDIDAIKLNLERMKDDMYKNLNFTEKEFEIMEKEALKGYKFQ